MVDSVTQKVIHIDWPSQYASQASESTLDFVSAGKEASLNHSTTAPPALDASRHRERIPPPKGPQDFLPDLLKQAQPNFKIRDDIKPLHVVQPEGVSFKMNGNELEWQKWKMHIGTILFPSSLF